LLYKSSLQSKLMNQAALSITHFPQPTIRSDLPEKWQQILSDLITDPKELVQLLELDASLFLASAATLLGNSARRIVLVRHCIHTQGLSPELIQDLSLLATNGVLSLNKSVF
jgi:L-lysine 2,3-aminomutase|tara:strand:- start:9139 stop:9474 length:336 start_codon:yes stop_codon:yes gene_type:complete